LPETIYFPADSGRYRGAMGIRQHPVHFQGGFRQTILGAQDEYGFIRTDARDLYIAIFAGTCHDGFLCKSNLFLVAYETIGQDF
jgi:hypothetical protein